MKLIIVINFKTDKQGKQVLKLAKTIKKINKNIIIGVQASDIEEIARKTRLKVYAQHVDYFFPYQNSGFGFLTFTFSQEPLFQEDLMSFSKPA